MIAGILMLAVIGAVVIYGMTFNSKLGDKTTCPNCLNVGAVLYKTGKVQGRKVVRFRCKKCNSYFDR